MVYHDMNTQRKLNANGVLCYRLIIAPLFFPGFRFIFVKYEGLEVPHTIGASKPCQNRS